jgi:thioesterase domain-containing protein/acyl carrier protein
VAFAVPHVRLGEEVGAAVVLREDATVTAAQLRVFVGERLASYKVPRRVVVVDEVPRGPSGKFERRTMATRLGLDGARRAPAVLPADPTETDVAAIWQRVLGTDEYPSVDVDFFDVGGDSLHATELLLEIEATFGRHLPATIFFTGATVRGMASELRAPTAFESDATVVPVQPSGSRPPLFCLLRGGSIVTIRHFAKTLGPDQPVYGLWVPWMHGPPDAAGSVEDIAAACVQAITRVAPYGPYFLFGHSLGGVVMYDVARQLAAAGHTIGLLVLADSVHHDIVERQYRARRTVRYRARKLFSRRGPSIVAYRIRWALGRAPKPPVRLVPGTDVQLDWAAAMERERRYLPGAAPGPVAVLATSAYVSATGGEDLGWASALVAGYETHRVPGSHDSMIGEPHVHVLAATVADCLARARARVSRT